MYNFRYHLVTIVAIFAALAIGLLLGAAVTGSDLVKGGGTDLVDSLMVQFEQQKQENDQLSGDLKNEERIGALLLGQWQANRLQGRVILLLAGSDQEDNDILGDAERLANDCGASTVTVRLLRPHYGLDDANVLSALQAVLPAVAGEDGEQALANALISEWTAKYELTATGNPSAGGTAPQANGNAAAPVILPDPGALASRYPLTKILADHGVLLISVDYGTMISAADYLSSPAQLQFVNQASKLGVPYAVNGVIDLSVDHNTSPATANQDALLLDKALKLHGEAGGLYCLLGSDHTGLPDPTTARPVVDFTKANYYVVLTQSADFADIMAGSAEENGFSCITDAEDTAGRYGLVALLSGGQPGIYGTARSQDSGYPPVHSSHPLAAVFKE
ncbi:MAG: copper transporter [Actinomycetia bacterium]|nr:copper transporter [Actinomycetes bacterium]